MIILANQFQLHIKIIEIKNNNLYYSSRSIHEISQKLHHLLRNHEIVLISNELKKTSQWPKIDSLQKLAFTLSTYVKSIHSKGGVILEGILTLVPLPTKSAKSLSCAENLNFPP